MWWIGSDVKAAGSIPNVSNKFRIARIIIPACLIKQPNEIRIDVQTYIKS